MSFSTKPEVQAPPPISVRLPGFRPENRWVYELLGLPFGFLPSPSSPPGSLGPAPSPTDVTSPDDQNPRQEANMESSAPMQSPVLRLVLDHDLQQKLVVGTGWFA